MSATRRRRSRGRSSLVIVESPAKARTIGRLLGPRYRVLASVGHVMDLPKSSLGVDVEHDFAPRYLVPREKRAVVAELKEAAAQAEGIYLATDPDREGEAISWHIVQATGLQDRSVQRVVFHEITQEAVEEAFAHPRELDMPLIDAQQARRVLDRLVGYRLSPLLWRKMRGGLSAGRVQSAALKLVVDREREVRAFLPQEYWTIEAELRGSLKEPSFHALLVADADSGEKVEIATEAEAQQLLGELGEATYRVASVRRRQSSRQPPPPFITSTLQQEAFRQLSFSAQRTMALAQQLYEGLPLGSEGTVGLITYMRTDSTHLAPSAQQEARALVEELFGPSYLPARPRASRKKVPGAQEAHEAIRPTSVRRRPETVAPSLNSAQARLYGLVWRRLMASQMAAARLEITTVEVVAACPSGRRYLLRASASRLLFPGYRALYEEPQEDEDTPERNPLPSLSSGATLSLQNLQAAQHFTQPPARYTEASLIRALEEKGIGRPSTYASILSTLTVREYVAQVARHLEPTALGEMVCDLLTEHFPNIVNEGFTARMEGELDEIARGQKAWLPVVQAFYHPFQEAVLEAQTQLSKVELPEEVTEELCPTCGRPMAVKRSRYGRFLGCTGYPECRGKRPLPRAEATKTGVACPQCGRELVGRRAARGRGRPFYGCSGYPECTFTVNRQPLTQPCPSCGGLLVRSGTQGAQCLSCQRRWAPSELEEMMEAREPAAAVRS